MIEIEEAEGQQTEGGYWVEQGFRELESFDFRDAGGRYIHPETGEVLHWDHVDMVVFLDGLPINLNPVAAASAKDGAIWLAPLAAAGNWYIGQDQEGRPYPTALLAGKVNIYIRPKACWRMICNTCATESPFADSPNRAALAANEAGWRQDENTLYGWGHICPDCLAAREGRMCVA